MKIIQIEIPVWVKTIVAGFAGGILGAAFDAACNYLVATPGPINWDELWHSVRIGAAVFILGYLKESPWRKSLKVVSQPVPPDAPVPPLVTAVEEIPRKEV